MNCLEAGKENFKKVNYKLATPAQSLNQRKILGNGPRRILDHWFQFFERRCIFAQLFCFPRFIKGKTMGEWPPRPAAKINGRADHLSDQKSNENHPRIIKSDINEKRRKHLKSICGQSEHLKNRLLTGWWNKSSRK